MRLKILLLLTLPIFILAFQSVNQLFYSQQVAGTITDSRLIEASGIDEAYRNPGHFWTHNDSGSKPILYLIDSKGQIVMELKLNGIKNRDWEEIVTVKKGNQSYIYIAEIGDNKAIHNDVQLIRLKEPMYTGSPKMEVEKDQLEIMRFGYEEGARDAEAVLYDYNSDEFLLVTKREDNALVYSFPFQKNESITKIKSKGTVPTKLFTASDMNEQGEILLKHYSAIYYWGKSDESALSRILEWNPVTVDYTPEPQGEAMCWYQQNFYTISEKNKGKPQEMLYFQRMN